MKKLVLLFLFLVSFLGISQQADYVDFKTAKAKIKINPRAKEVGGHVSYTFEILKDIDSIYLDAQNFTHIEALFNERIYHTYNGKQFIINHPFKKGDKHQVDIGFVAHPKKALYFIDWGDTSKESTLSAVEGLSVTDGNKQVWTQGQGKYTSNWLPSIDDMNEKIEFDLSITFDKNYEVIANGNLTTKQLIDSTTTWHYDMQHPMPSYLVALAIGKYKKKVEHSKSGVPLEMYYYPNDSSKFEPTYRYTKQMFDFLEDEIGVPYPWQNYKMVPVKDFLYAGMENTSLNIYSDAFVVDSIAFIDRNFVNINAHELAHQWFGDLLTATSGTHHWLQEGFATYYALLAEKDIFGEDYYYWQLYEYAQELLDQDKAGQSTSLLDPKSSSTTFYKKGAWVLHILREKVGDEAFKEAVKKYLEKHQFENVDTDDFIGEVENSSGADLSDFIKIWLKDVNFNYSKCLENLKRNSKLISTLDDLDKELLFSSHSPTFSIERYFGKANKSQIKSRLLSKDLLDIVEDKDIYKEALNSNDVKVRQAIAQNLTDIPSELKKDYEALLNDNSYITIETALFNLWKNFPKDRAKYLNQTKDIIGFNDKNVRILWLTLALITEEYEPENKPKYFKEITNYTSPQYGFEVRQNAFQYLHQIQACDDACKVNLKQATTHHNWRFKKFAKSLLEEE